MIKSTEVYKLLHLAIGNDLKSVGFKRGKSSVLSYQKMLGHSFLIVWFQCNKWGFDEYSGSSFCINLQKSQNSKLGMDMKLLDKSIYERIPKYLNEEELDEILLKQNIVINTLPKPNKEYIEAIKNAVSKKGSSGQVLKAIFGPWEQLDKPYRSNSDIWFKYYTQDDVTMWANYLRTPIIRTLQLLENCS